MKKSKGTPTIIFLWASVTLLTVLACSSKKVARDRAERNPPSASENEVASIEPSKEKSVHMDLVPTVHFAFDSAVLNKTARSLIHKKALELKKTANEINIIGACDERGSEAYNLKLGMRRARSVRAEFEKWGVKASKIQIRSVGKSHPIARGHDEESWAQNRRAEMHAIVNAAPVASR